jgi:hypothetical protein
LDEVPDARLIDRPVGHTAAADRAAPSGHGWVNGSPR